MESGETPIIPRKLTKPANLFKRNPRVSLVNFDRKRVPDPLDREVLSQALELVADVDVVGFLPPLALQELKRLSTDVERADVGGIRGLRVSE